MLLSTFKIDINKIKKRNAKLIKNKWIDKLTAKQKKYLDWRKGGNSILNSDGLRGYRDLSNYLLNSDKFYEIQIDYLRDYMEIFDIKTTFNKINIANITVELNKLLTEIQKHRIASIQKYIKIEESIFKKGIHADDIVYRVQNEPFNGDIIQNSTSWSLTPIEFFCNSPICYLYVTKIPKNIKVMYIENDSKDKNLKTFQDMPVYEYEFILPCNLKFKLNKTKKIKVVNKMYKSKNPRYNFNYQIYIIFYITIIKQVKALPKINNVIKLIAK
jgi:hypothetical protein